MLAGVSGSRITVAEAGLSTTGVRTRSPARAYFVKGPSGSPLSLGRRPVIVGADPTVDLPLSDPKVSGRHAELLATPEGIRVKDLGSTNGTFVDGTRITEALARPGANIRCGQTILTVAATPPQVVAPSPRERFGGLVGVSRAMREVFAVLELASQAEATVLIQGESGTGKELAARALHDHSPRAGGPLVIVDCGALSESLLDAQLFGHRAGAFTGAIGERKGAFLEGHGGTVFLDEIGELPLASQAKLLRALEARTVTPLGSDRPVPFDAKVVAATHRDLAAMVEAGTFRFDLFHRLAVVHVYLPPLRDRPEDLVPLVRAFYDGRGVAPGPIEGPALAALEALPLRGNARELRNLLERAWVLAGPGGAHFSRLILTPSPSAADVAPSRGPRPAVRTDLPFKEAKELWNAEFEREYLAELFERHGGNITRAAEEARIQRRHFRELLVHHGLKEPE